jgi:hypothetical protein
MTVHISRQASDLYLDANTTACDRYADPRQTTDLLLAELAYQVSRIADALTH